MRLKRAKTALLTLLLLAASSTCFAQLAQLVRQCAPPITGVQSWAGLPANSNLSKGTQVNLSALRGKVVLVEFWATWCGPCIASMPHTQELYDKNKSRGLEVLSVSQVDERQTEKKIQDFATSRKLNFPTAIINADDTKTDESYSLDSIPRAVLIDRQGKIVWSGHPMSPEMGTVLESLLTEPSPSADTHLCSGNESVTTSMPATTTTLQRDLPLEAPTVTAPQNTPQNNGLAVPAKN